jgi:hypothetical protein
LIFKEVTTGAVTVSVRVLESTLPETAEMSLVPTAKVRAVPGHGVVQFGMLLDPKIPLEILATDRVADLQRT